MPMVDHGTQIRLTLGIHWDQDGRKGMVSQGYSQGESPPIVRRPESFRLTPRQLRWQSLPSRISIGGASFGGFVSEVLMEGQALKWCLENAVLPALFPTPRLRLQSKTPPTGNCFRALRTVDGQDADWRLGVGRG